MLGNQLYLFYRVVKYRYHLDILERMCSTLVVIPAPMRAYSHLLTSRGCPYRDDSSIVAPATKSTDVPVGVFSYMLSNLYQFPQISSSIRHALRAEVFRGN